MDIRTQSSLLAAIVSVALAVSMLLRPQRTKAVTLFSVLCATLGAWYLGDFLHALGGHGFWLRVRVATGAAIPAGALAFFLEFLGVAKRSARRGRTVALVGALFGLAVSVTPLARLSSVRIAVAVWVFGALTVSLSLLYRRMRASAARIERARLAYLFVGALLALGASILDFAPPVGLLVPPLGAMVTALYLFFLAQTLQTHRLLDLHELLGKFAALSVLALILAVFYGGLVLWSGDRPGFFLFHTLVASFVILNLFEPLRVKVEEWVIAALFRERFELIRVLGALKARLFSVIDPHVLARVILDSLHESRRVTHVSVYLLADTRPGFSLLDHRGPAPVPFLDATAARGLLAAASSGQKAVLLENVERRSAELTRMLGAPGGKPPADPDEETLKLLEEQTRLAELRAALGAMKAGISIPLVGADRVLGFLNLWDERLPEAYSSDEIALMLEIADRASMIIENSKLFERMKERDRLAALGEMAAGLAHEIRNPLGAIKGAAQFLDPRGEDAEWIGVIVEEVDRLNGVVTQFLDYSRPLKSSLSPTDVADVIERTVKLVRAELPAGIELALDLRKVPRAQTDAEQLKQVLINLFRNAVQAMPEGGRLTVATLAPEEGPFRLERTRLPEFVEIRVRDSGPGVPEEHRENVFVPFFTTKEKGTGLGLAICQRIIRHHGGTLSLVARPPGEGAEFSIRLPVAAEPAAAPAPPAGTGPALPAVAGRRRAE